MQIPVLVERMEGNGFRARGIEPFGATGEGATQEEAIQQFRDQIESWIAAGARVVQLTLPSSQHHPWARFFGTWDENDPAVKQWEEQVEAYRRERDGDPDLA